MNVSITAEKPQVAQAQKRKIRRALVPLNPRSDCALCQLPHTDDLVIDLLQARQPRTKIVRDRAINAVLEGTGISRQTELTHHNYHRAPQPSPNRVKITEGMPRVYYVLEKVSKRAEIVDFIARARLVSPELISTLFWPGQRAGTVSARQELREVLAPYHLAYRVWFGDYTKGSNHQIYGLGHAGAEWMSQRTGYSWQWIADPEEDVGFSLITHDLEVCSQFAVLVTNSGALANGTAETFVSTRNFRTAHQLEMALLGQEKWARRLTDPNRIPDKLKGRGSKFINIGPDAITGIGVKLNIDLPGVPQQSFNPLLIENDAGTKDPIDVANQLISHILLARSGAVQRRVPQLKSWRAIPVLFIFSHRDHRRDLASNRIRRIIGLTKEKLALIGLDSDLPLWFVHRDDWMTSDLQAPSYGLWDDDDQWEQDAPPSVLIRLLRANSVLNEGDPLPVDTVLEIDPLAARQAKKARAQSQKSEAPDYKQKINALVSDTLTNTEGRDDG